MNEDDEVQYEGTGMPKQLIAKEKFVLRKIKLFVSKQIKKCYTSVEANEKIFKERTQKFDIQQQKQCADQNGQKKVH